MRDHLLSVPNITIAETSLSFHISKCKSLGFFCWLHGKNHQKIAEQIPEESQGFLGARKKVAAFPRFQNRSVSRTLRRPLHDTLLGEYHGQTAPHAQVTACKKFRWWSTCCFWWHCYATKRNCAHGNPLVHKTFALYNSLSNRRALRKTINLEVSVKEGLGQHLCKFLFLFSAEAFPEHHPRLWPPWPPTRTHPIKTVHYPLWKSSRI